MNRALALHITCHMRDCVLGRYRYQHMHVIGLQMPFQHSTFLLASQAVQHLAKILTELIIKHFSTAIGYPYYMKLVFQLDVA